MTISNRSPDAGQRGRLGEHLATAELAAFGDAVAARRGSASASAGSERSMPSTASAPRRPPVTANPPP